MNTQEAAALLGIAAAFDNRKPDPDAAHAWSVALGDLRFEDARDAIVAHYRVSSDWLMPSIVIAGAKRIRSKRLLEYGPISPPPELDPGDTQAYADWIRAEQAAIGDGRKVREPVSTAAVNPPRDWRTLGEIGRAVDDA